MTNSCCSDNLPVCILHLGENGLEKYRLAKKWEQFKIVLLFMDHPVVAQVHQNGELRSAELFDAFLMGQVLPHASPVFSPKPVFFLYFR